MVVYHHNDIDGIAAGAIIANKTKDIENTTYKMTNYGDSFDLHIRNDGFKEDVMLLDISFSEATYYQFKKICNEANNVIWIDHHATSIDLIRNHIKEFQSISNLTYFVNNEYCGSLLTYVYMNLPTKDLVDIRNTNNKETYNITVSEDNGSNTVKVQLLKYSNNTLLTNIDHEVKIPKWLIYVDDYDCWKKKYKESNYFQLGITSENNYNVIVYNDMTNSIMLNSLWTNIISLSADPIVWVEKGETIYNYLMRRYKDEFGDTFVWKYDGKSFICKNGTGNSYNFLEEMNKYDGAILFNYSGKSGKWEYSIYSDDNTGINCKEFAEKFNGGGHIHASGFSTKELIFTHPTYRKLPK